MEADPARLGLGMPELRFPFNKAVAEWMLQNAEQMEASR